VSTELLEPILALHDGIRDAVVQACEAQNADAMAEVAHDDAGDTIYAVDRVSEEALVAGFSKIAESVPIHLIAEGLPPGGVSLPEGTKESDCKWRVLVDPIDGTRGLMYQKRPAWILTGVAPNHGSETRLSNIVLAVQTEIPLVKQHLSDQLWATRDGGVYATRFNRVTSESTPIKLHPSRADNLTHGFSSVSRFFPGARDILAAIDDEIALTVTGGAAAGKALLFEDQYISTGGQLYELMAGHDRFIADIRPELSDLLAKRGMPHPLCCHPYDLCTILIARELGVVLTDAHGRELDAPLDIEADVSWVGYANAALRSRVEPALRSALESRLV
jgi:fructose-1,6-bisphosphatase/inositol monophosphatase family enzyme